MTTAREYDANGWMEIKDNPISKVGVFPYRGLMVDPTGELGLDPDSVVMVYRSAEALSNPETIESFKLIPWVDDHEILGNGSDSLTPPEDKGIDGVIGEDVYFSDGYLYGNLKVFTGSLTESIADGKTELSCGYRCAYELEQGMFGDSKYDAVQTNIRGNHLASVDEGRMGPEVSVLDHQLTFTIDSKDFQIMATETLTLDERLKKLTPKNSAKLSAALDAMEEAESKAEDMDDDDESKAEDNDDADRELGEDMDDDESKTEDMDDDESKTEDMDDDESKTEDMDDEEKEGATGTDAADVKSLRREVKILQVGRQGQTRDVLREMRERTKLYDAVSEHVGAFDHDDMSTGQIARYACDKLDVPAPRGQAKTAIAAYLTHRPARPAFASDQAIGSAKSAADGGIVGKYLRGSA